MIVNTLIDGRAYTFNTEDERQVIGEGGEAVVMRWLPPREFTARHGNGAYAVKLYFEGTPEQRAAATVRQSKLRSLPKGLPANAVQPRALATSAAGQIIGYVMPLIEDVQPLVKYMDAQWRKQQKVTHKFIVQVLTNLHALVASVHRAGVIIGDFNDKNVLVNRSGEVFLIDVDSGQWGKWPCLVATPEFSDPKLLDENQNLKKGARYSPESDWYSYTVMVYQLLTLSHPYRDGVHKPVQVAGQPRMARQRFPDRVTMRLSVFDPNVHLDVSAHHPASLPETMGGFMHEVFVKDGRRFPFPVDLLRSFRWMTCRCGYQHGRTACPKCRAVGFPAPSTPRQTHRPMPPQAPPVSAQASNNRAILAVASNGTLQYVCYENGAYRREDGAIVWQRDHHPDITPLVAGSRTVFAAGSEFAIVGGNSPAKRHKTQHVFGRTTVATNSRHTYWVSNDSLVRDDPKCGIVRIGAAIPNLTSVWVGERFGVMLVRAGILTRVQTFTDTQLTGSHYLSPEFGEVIDAQCVISDSHAWVKVVVKLKSGDVVHRCYVFDARANLLATADSPRSDSWLGCMTTSALAAGDKLFVPAPALGIVRIGIAGGTLREEGAHHEAARLMHSGQTTVGLCLTNDGLVYASQHSLSKV